MLLFLLSLVYVHPGHFVGGGHVHLFLVQIIASTSFQHLHRTNRSTAFPQLQTELEAVLNAVLNDIYDKCIIRYSSFKLGIPE